MEKSKSLISRENLEFLRSWLEQTFPEVVYDKQFDFESNVITKIREAYDNLKPEAQFSEGSPLFPSMEVVQSKFDFTKDYPEGDFHKAEKHCSFMHNKGCEFLFFLGSCPNSRKTELETYKEQGFSESFLSLVRQAQAQGASYLCLYQG